MIWGDVDIMFIDMPPGTGDVPLTVFQSIPVDGIVIVTSPQELVGMIVEKAVNMAALMHIPVLGLVENMSYAHLPRLRQGNPHLRREPRGRNRETPRHPNRGAATDGAQARGRLRSGQHRAV